MYNQNDCHVAVEPENLLFWDFRSQVKIFYFNGIFLSNLIIAGGCTAARWLAAPGLRLHEPEPATVGGVSFPFYALFFFRTWHNPPIYKQPVASRWRSGRLP